MGDHLQASPINIHSVDCAHIGQLHIHLRQGLLHPLDAARRRSRLVVDKVEESLHRGHKRLSSRRALATMSVIASTGAMLFSGRPKHQ
jgi:hypothetical protein